MQPAAGPVVMALKTQNLQTLPQNDSSEPALYRGETNFSMKKTPVLELENKPELDIETLQSSPNLVDSGTTSPGEPDDDDKLDSLSDLQFKKKDVRKSRTHLFQLVLSTASLKLLKQQYAAGIPPTAHRNSSVSGVSSQNNIKNFQLFIQAPVLSSVTNLRDDDIAIGQQLPFEQITGQSSTSPKVEMPDDDIYREETTLQQQKLTLNALKKLSLSLAPIIRSDSDEMAPSLQLTTQLLNSSSPKPERRPYQPAQVDLLTFLSLTRQSRHLAPVSGEENAEPAKVERVEEQSHPSPTEAGPEIARGNEAPLRGEFGNEERNGIDITRPLNDTRNGTDFVKPAPEAWRDADDQTAYGFQPVSSFSKGFPVVPPLDMNVRNRKVSLQHDHVPNPPKMPLDKKLQQIKGFRSPMYVPAVLRRTMEEEGVIPVRTSALDPESYFEPVQDSSSNSVRLFDLTYSNELVGSPASQAGPFTLNKKQYEYILRAAPSRKHWLKDESVFECGIPGCHKHFNFFERRHHCRKCGGIFCKEHTSHHLYINHLAQFTTGGRGTLSRVCDNCIGEYNDFMKLEFGVACTPKGKDIQPAMVPFNPERIQKGQDDKVDVAGSVPANWSWSSF